MELKGEDETAVGVDKTKGIVLLLVVTTNDDTLAVGGIWTRDVVLVTSLLVLGGNVIVVTKGLVTRIVDIIGTDEELGLVVEKLAEKAEGLDVFVKMTVVGVMIFVIFTTLENPPEAIVAFSFVVEMLEEVIRLIDLL